MDVRLTDGALTRDLRRRVLRADAPPDSPLPGDDRPDALHLGAFDDEGRLLGTCLVYPEPCDWRPEVPAWQLRAMAVDPDRRHGGVGRAVLAGAVHAATEAGAAVLWCHARETAAGFWHGAGWRDRHPDGDPGQVYVEPVTGLPHRDLYRPLH